MENKDKLKDFFANYKVPQPVIEVEENNPAIIENDFLFNTPLSDVDAFIKLEELKIKSKLKIEKIKTLRNDRKLRKNNANKAFCFVYASVLLQLPTTIRLTQLNYERNKNNTKHLYF